MKKQSPILNLIRYSHSTQSIYSNKQFKKKLQLTIKTRSSLL